MKYKGYIFGSITPVKNAGVDPAELHFFKLICFWYDNKNQKVGYYRLSDEKGNVIPELKHLLFTRSQTNEFYLESIGRG